jgi:hypothetical protein
VIGLDNRHLVILSAVLTLLLFSAAAIMILAPAPVPSVPDGDGNITHPPLSQLPSDGTGWVAYLGERGILMENASDASVSAPREVAPGVTYLALKESFVVDSDAGPVVLVKTSDVYVNMRNGEAAIAGYYVTTADAEKDGWDLFLEQLDPDSINNSGG